MRRGNQSVSKRREPTIALINVVFLMLVFFLIAGTIAPPVDPDIQLVSLAEVEGSQPSKTLAIHPDGRVVWEGEDVDATQFVAKFGVQETLRLLPDRSLPAQKLLELATQLQADGSTELLVVTQRGVK